MAMRRLIKAQTRRGVQLDGVLFDKGGEHTVVIAITGIHGNFYSNPMYYNIGETLSDNGIAFIYAQTNDAFNRMETLNTTTGRKELIGTYDRFSYGDPRKFIELINSHTRHPDQNE